METKKITPEMYAKLKEPLNTEAIKQHPTKTYLSSIKSIYVTERLNEVFGVGSWQIRTERIEHGDKGMIVVKVILQIPEYGVYYESYGGNDNGGQGSKNFDLGDAYKGAVTDGITKIGSWMGIAIDVFKGLNDSPNKSNAPEPEKWLNLFTKDGAETEEYRALQKAISEGKKYTLSGMRKKYKVSKQTASELSQHFNIQ